MRNTKSGQGDTRFPNFRFILVLREQPSVRYLTHINKSRNIDMEGGSVSQLLGLSFSPLISGRPLI